jgi:hypothetical protein
MPPTPLTWTVRASAEVPLTTSGHKPLLDRLALILDTLRRRARQWETTRPGQRADAWVELFLHRHVIAESEPIERPDSQARRRFKRRHGCVAGQETSLLFGLRQLYRCRSAPGSS